MDVRTILFKYALSHLREISAYFWVSFFAALFSAFIQKLTNSIVMLFLTVSTKLTVAYIVILAYVVCPISHFLRYFFSENHFWFL